MEKQERRPLQEPLEATLKQIEERHSKTSVSEFDFEAEEKQRRIKERLLTIPTAYRELASDKYDLNMLNKNIFITGPCGTGKTVLACHVAREHIFAGVPVQYHGFPALIMRLQSIYRDQTKDPFAEAREIARFMGVMVLDDIGAEKLTDYVRQMTYFIINEREQWRLKTIITSNFTLEQLNDFIDPRIASRIAGMCEVLILDGRDRRLLNNITSK